MNIQLVVWSLNSQYDVALMKQFFEILQTSVLLAFKLRDVITVAHRIHG